MGRRGRGRVGRRTEEVGGRDGARKRGEEEEGRRSFKGGNGPRMVGPQSGNFATCNKLLLLVTDRANVQRF